MNLLTNTNGLTWLGVFCAMMISGHACLAFGGELYSIQNTFQNRLWIEIPPPLMLADHCRGQALWSAELKPSAIQGSSRKSRSKRIAEVVKEGGAPLTGAGKEALERIFANTKPSKALVKAELVDLLAKNSCPQGWELAEGVGPDGSFRCRINPRESVQTNLIFCEKPLRYFARGQTIGCFMG